MARVYLVDAYNVLLQDDRLDDLVHRQGLEEARRVFRGEVEAFGRRVGIHVRLIYDGARGPFDHRDTFDSPWVHASFTSAGESADDRVVAVALELKRKGHAVMVVSDDEEGVRRPLRSAGVQLISSRDFARTMRRRPAEPEDRSGALSLEDRQALERNFLARDAARQQREDEARRRRHAAPPVPVDRPPPPPLPPARGPEPPHRLAPARRPVDEAALRARKERGARKQARRLQQMQNRKKPS